MRRRKIWAAAALLLAAVLTAIPAVALTVLDRQVGTILVVGKVEGEDIEFWRSVHDGLKAAAEEYGVTYEFRAPADESDIEAQRALLAEAVRERPAALVWVATDHAMTAEAEMLSASGIRYVMMDSDVDYSGGTKCGFVGTDNYAAAREAGRRAARDNPGREAVILVHAAFAETGRERMKGFADGYREITGTEPAVYDCGNSTAGAAACARKLIAEHPEAGLLFATNEVVTLGAVPVLLEAGYKEQLAIYAFDCSKKQIQYLENGTFRAIVAQYPFRMGYRAMQAAVRVARGKSLPAEIDTGTMWVDEENLYDRAVQEIIFPFK